MWLSYGEAKLLYWDNYGKENGNYYVIMGCILGFLAELSRGQMLFLVFLNIRNTIRIITIIGVSSSSSSSSMTIINY